MTSRRSFSMGLDILGFMLNFLPSSLQGQDTKILDPDGPPVSPETFEEESPKQLEKWLQERKHLRQNQSQDEVIAGSANENSEKQENKAKTSAPYHGPSLRMAVNVLYPKAFGPVTSRTPASFDPSPHLSLLHPLTTVGANQSTQLLLGVRVMNVSGVLSQKQQSLRYSWTYFGPMVAWEWSQFSTESAEDLGRVKGGRQRARLSLSLNAVSRQSERTDASLYRDNASLAIDGTGLSLEGSYDFRVSENLDWQILCGVQHNRYGPLLYLGVGISPYLSEHPAATLPSRGM